VDNKPGQSEDNEWGTEWGIVPLKWQGSIVLLLARILNDILLCLSVMTWLWYVHRWLNRKWRLWIVEVWVLCLVAVLFLCLVVGYHGNIVIWWVAFYILLDALGATVRDIVGPLSRRDADGGYVLIYDGVRWLLMAAINVIQVVLCFAVFALHYGKDFKPAILDSVTAIYFSAVTFLTLGYGDVVPRSPQTKALVVWELLTFLVFLVVKLPIAVSVIRVKERQRATN